MSDTKVNPESAIARAKARFFATQCSPGANSSEFYHDIYNDAWKSALDAVSVGLPAPKTYSGPIEDRVRLAAGAGEARGWNEHRQFVDKLVSSLRDNDPTGPRGVR